ncbi:chymotrypsin-2 [Zeugodacus cucurbitae]|uniref:Chymotrypsin-2 n=1 Tax=Zeugodacus cucurbitae TaxID=28588 RepID=A0A0A1XEJ1_ZEUCU|nr:chymotrypsin-2 [Zeugodacus cucurbitae]XP_054089835.1 chymotrypsin-2 [Zeugodacus cucurbitae]
MGSEVLTVLLIACFLGTSYTSVWRCKGTIIELDSYFESQDFNSQERVVGGAAVPDGEYIPYQVSMQYRTRSGKDRHFCGGSIIAPNRILTAAHCVNGQDAKRISVVAGIRDLNDSSGIRSQVLSFEIHENYEELVTSDIAILKIEPSFELDGVKINQVDVSGSDKVNGGHAVTLSGWGAMWHVGQGPLAIYPTLLQRMSYKTITNEQCKRVMTQLTETEICALERFGKGACNGDSGGPLVMDNGGSLKQVGVVSYGTALCASNSPDVYTRVSMFDDWIKARLN